ncbi:nitroreductase family protein [Curvibacter sp. APW13]|uniref:nitroreductase family protein n=1 Tax=Curvibacter sp. APW13 TaxID=3077236 RepID=UPI0028DDDCA8|nr:nitroreductase family protein [Curvibacter sp. APW13]MDT8990766.1 nitroreductase family protein [Curvibacter sp. APW13]
MSAVDGLDAVQWVQTLIHSRANVGPKRLVAPGPDVQQLTAMLESACAAPDHGRLRPWRLVLVPQDKRALLAQAFVDALLERDATATPEQRGMAAEKAFRAPVLLVAVARLASAEPPLDAEQQTGTPVHDFERLVTLGCAIQNILLSAHAAGFGAGLTSGQAMRSHALRRLLALQAHEHAVCCINLGTVSRHRPAAERPGLGDSLQIL